MKTVKKVAVVVLALALLMTFAAVPVMAVSPKKIEATADTITEGGYTGPFEVRITPGEVAHIYYGFYGTIILHTPTSDIVFDYVDALKGSDFTPNLDDDKVAHRIGYGTFQVREIWTNPAGTGGFEGMAIWKASAIMMSYFTSRTVLQGWGRL